MRPPLPAQNAELGITLSSGNDSIAAVNLAPISGPVRPSPVTQRLSGLAAVVSAFLAPLIFAGVTRQVWEDYYITFRSSRNLVEGHGLVYQIGEAVHTFTSPLGVLLPALGFALTGSDSGALWFLRLVSAVALAFTTWIVLKHARENEWSPAIVWFALILGVFEAKTIAFSANGMETAVLVAFAAGTWYELTRAAGVRWQFLALGYAGLMWTRPDACVFAAALTAACWMFRRRAGVSSADAGRWWVQFGRAVLLGVLLYVPWVIWADSFYGSPVPQTIIAKSALTPSGLALGRILVSPLSILVDVTALDGLFAPIYATTSGWPEKLLLAFRLLARISAFLWLVPFLKPATRAASLTVLLGGVYFHQIMPYPWYFAPWTLLGALAVAAAGREIIGRLPATGASLLRVAGAVTAGSMLLVNFAQTYAAQQQQSLIEENGRKQIGLWLRAHARPTDTVFLEPIGYIGYFSGLKILDYPGLCAPEVSRIVRSGPGGYARIIRTLQPDWLVLRPFEIESQNLLHSGTLNAYTQVRQWDQQSALAEREFLPGRNWLQFDAQFVVFRRRGPDELPGEIRP